MRRVWWLGLAFVVFLVGCGLTSEDPGEDDTDITPAPTEVAIGEDGEPIETTTTLPPEEDPDAGVEEDDEGVLRIATLLPIESGKYEGEHWFKWKLGEPIPDPAEDYIRTYQLTIRSLEDDIFGIGYTLPRNEEPFIGTYCFEDRPNCTDGVIPGEVDVLDNGDTLLFRIPEGSFEQATGLDVSAHIMSFPTADSDPLNELIADGASDPVGLEERDPC